MALPVHKATKELARVNAHLGVYMSRGARRFHHSTHWLLRMIPRYKLPTELWMLIIQFYMPRGIQVTNSLYAGLWTDFDSSLSSWQLHSWIVCLMVCLPLLYGEKDWRLHQRDLLPRLCKTNDSQTLVERTGRRVGVTTMLRHFVWKLMKTLVAARIPAKICIIATGQRSDSGLFYEIWDRVERASGPSENRRITNRCDHLCKEIAYRVGDLKIVQVISKTHWEWKRMGHCMGDVLVVDDAHLLPAYFLPWLEAQKPANAVIIATSYSDRSVGGRGAEDIGLNANDQRTDEPNGAADEDDHILYA
jgi:hypothetical protein